MFILKILFAPLSLILSLFVWLCAGLLSWANASACFSKIPVYFLANLGYNISKKEVIT